MNQYRHIKQFYHNESNPTNIPQLCVFAKPKPFEKPIFSLQSASIIRNQLVPLLQKAISLYSPEPVELEIFFNLPVACHFQNTQLSKIVFPFLKCLYIQLILHQPS